MGIKHKIAAKKRWANKEYREKVSKAHSHKLPTEWKANISNAKKGIVPKNHWKKGHKCFTGSDDKAANWKGGHWAYLRRKSRIVMAKILGRNLLSSEIVHHLDHDIANNNPDNLFLFQNRSEHQIYHELKKSWIREFVEKDKVS